MGLVAVGAAILALGIGGLVALERPGLDVGGQSAPIRLIASTAAVIPSMPSPSMTSAPAEAPATGKTARRSDQVWATPAEFAPPD